MKVIKTTLRQIRRTPYQAISAIAVLTVTFFVGTIFALVAFGSQVILKHFETRPQVIAYLKDEVTPEILNPLKNQLESTNKTEEVRFVSKSEALAIYKESVGDDPLLLGTITDLSAVTADILPASLEISVTNPEYFPEIVEILKDSDLVDTNSKGEKDIDFPQDVVSELTAWTKGLRLGGLTLIIALLFSSVLTITIIISMKIGHRRFEISTLKLLGANNSYVATPYILESILYSFTGALFGWLFSYIAFLYATPFLAPRLAGIITLPPSPLFMFEVLIGALLTALLLGLFSGSLAVGRFLSRR